MTATAASLVLALEAEGTPSPEQLAAARAAQSAELAAITAAMFEPAAARPRSADDITTFQWLTGRFSNSTYDVQLAAAHRTALGDSPGVAALCVTAEALEDVASAAQAAAGPAARAAQAAETALRRFQTAICEQLTEGSDAPSAARAYLAAVQLEERIAAVEARAIAQAAAAAQAAEEERKAARRAELDRAVAALAVAAETARQARADADAADRAHHETKLAVFIERLKLSGLADLRTAHEVFDVSKLIEVAPQIGAYDLERFSAALDRAEESPR
jgi:hypothetical protein